VQNVTENNVVRVNGHVVVGGAWSPLQPQDLLVIGNTTLQLVAPLLNGKSCASMDASLSQGAGQDCPGDGTSPAGSNPQIGTRHDPYDQDNEQEWEQAPSLLSGVPMYFVLERLNNRPGRFFLVGGLLSIIVIAGTWLVLNSLFGLTQDGSSRLVLALLVPLIPALGINMLVHFIDRYERDPWFLRLAAFLWGAIIAIPLARFIESLIDGFVTNLWSLDSQVVLHAFLSGLDAGLTEETVKGLGLLLLFFFLRDKFDNITDGIVYGALIGAGFAMVENFYYFSNNTNDVSALIVGRIVLGWLSHSTFTICFGVALGYLRHTPVRWRRTVVPWSGYLLAVGLHTIFDFVEIFVRDTVPTYGNSPTVVRFAILAVIGNYIPLFLVQIGILFILIKSLMHEAEIIREFLPAEVAEGIVTVDEYALLPHSFARIRLERRVLWHYGIRQWLLTRALYQAEIGLAFCKWHTGMLQCSPTDRQNEESSMSPFVPGSAPMEANPAGTNLEAQDLAGAGMSDGKGREGTSPTSAQRDFDDPGGLPHRSVDDELASSRPLRSPDSFVPGYLQPEAAYRKRIKRIRQEIIALGEKRSE
jgi:RsiW-degrading membrane proteinase PrsW (M82 family)